MADSNIEILAIQKTYLYYQSDIDKIRNFNKKVDFIFKNKIADLREVEIFFCKNTL